MKKSSLISTGLLTLAGAACAIKHISDKLKHNMEVMKTEVESGDIFLYPINRLPQGVQAYIKALPRIGHHTSISIPRIYVRSKEDIIAYISEYYPPKTLADEKAWSNTVSALMQDDTPHKYGYDFISALNDNGAPAFAMEAAFELKGFHELRGILTAISVEKPAYPGISDKNVLISDKESGVVQQIQYSKYCRFIEMANMASQDIIIGDIVFLDYIHIV